MLLNPIELDRYYRTEQGDVVQVMNEIDNSSIFYRFGFRYVATNYMMYRPNGSSGSSDNGYRLIDEVPSTIAAYNKLGFKTDSRKVHTHNALIGDMVTGLITLCSMVIAATFFHFYLHWF